MFVFGEIQDPNVDTVNLVEDIVRSQIIELVRNAFTVSRRDPLFVCGRLYKLAHSQQEEEHDTFLPKISYFSFDMIGGRLIVFVLISLGRMYESMLKIQVVTEAEA